jgi:hypothetical protein
VGGKRWGAASGHKANRPDQSQCQSYAEMTCCQYNTCAAAHRGKQRGERGQLSGDPELVAAAIDRASALEGERIGPIEGPYSRTNHLASPISACTILADLFVPGTVTLTGDVPERPPIPPNAIG